MNQLWRVLIVLLICWDSVSAQEGFEPLFNGEDFSGWQVIEKRPGKKAGLFTVDKEQQAIHVYADKKAGSRQDIGCLYTKKQYSHYVLKLQYKWLEKKFAPRSEHDRDAGLLFHLHGDMTKLWPKCAEMQLGASEATKVRDRYTTGDLWVIGGDLRVINERKGEFYTPGSDPVAVGKGTMYDNSYTHTQNERPCGEWNDVTLTVRGGQGAVFELNGKVVNRVGSITCEVDGKRVPLEKGHIGLQAEYAELLYRNILIEQLKAEELKPDAPQQPQGEDLSWKELSEQYEVPKWFTDARFGVWVHWGAQSVPELGGGWYARHLYMKDVGRETFGKNAYPYHLKTFGHPSEKGFKDVIHQWKAEKLDTDKLLKYFTEDLGAKYFMALAHHHDNFDNWDSTYQEWNSTNVGPKRDVIGEFSTSAKKYDVPFGVTTHDERFFDWNLPAFGSDDSGEFKDVPYDGRLTKEEGIGQWWEGLDPTNLYGLPPEQRTPEWKEAWKQNWLLRMKDLLSKYQPDYLWFDGRGFPYGDYGKEAFRFFYNQSLKKHGKIDAVIAGKIPGGDPGILHDIEQGVESAISPDPWQSICTYTHWFYKKDDDLRHDAKSTIQLLIDVVSKNGNYVLNIELLPNGTIPPDHKIILDKFGSWLKLNGEAIYATKPWKIYGDNLLSRLADTKSKNANAANSDLVGTKKKTSKQFNNRTKDSPAYGNEEVRFTTKDDVLYVFVLNPIEGEIELPSLGFRSSYQPKPIQSISLIGSEKPIEFKQRDDKLIVSVPANRPNSYAAVFQVNGAL